MHHHQKKRLAFCILAFMLIACQSRQCPKKHELTSIYLIDRSGFKETISAPDRLAMFEKSDFLASQPYKKVTRTYSANEQGKAVAKVTAYHKNGQVAEYLELINGRAYGQYRSWHPNGALAVEAFVLEGLGDLTAAAKQTWVFDGVSCAYRETGGVRAKMHYEKGLLQGNAFYYHKNGKVQEVVPFDKGEIHGEKVRYSDKGELVEKMTYVQGLLDGPATKKKTATSPAYSESYARGLLMSGMYFDSDQKVVSQIEHGDGIKTLFKQGKLFEKREYRKGKQQGAVRRFHPDGQLINSFEVKNGVKDGEEWLYYPSSQNSPNPQCYIQWREGVVHGVCRSWYENGQLESEREFCENKKHGVASCWYLDGSIMLIENYADNLLESGSYREKGSKQIISSVEKGNGVAMLYDPDGRFLKKVHYDKGKPFVPTS